MHRVHTDSVPQTSSVSLPTTFNYNPSGTIYQVIDAKTQTTTFEYDPSDLKTKMTYPNGTDYQQYAYDNNLLGLSRYVHLNPVRGVSLGRGTPSERRERLRRFKWSSYCGCAGLGRAFPFVEDEMVLGELGGPRRAERVRYHRFVEQGLVREIENPFEAVRWQAVLGDESFVQKIRDRVKGLHKERREITSLRKVRPVMEPDQVLNRVARKYRVDRKRLLERGERGLQARNVAMWMVWETGTKSLGEIGELFGGLDYAAVAQRIRRTRLAHNAVTTRNLLAEMSNV
jgi:YD repeat-containing protein